MKQYIIINSDLNMSPGKIAGQAAHASAGYMYHALHNYYDASNLLSGAWKSVRLDTWFRDHNQRKIVVRLSEKELMKAMKKLDANEISYYAVRDMGATEVPADSLTAIAIEPMSKEDTPKWFARWRLL